MLELNKNISSKVIRISIVFRATIHSNENKVIIKNYMLM